MGGGCSSQLALLGDSSAAQAMKGGLRGLGEDLKNKLRTAERNVRLVRLSRLKALGRFPRWPEDALEATDLSAVKLSKAFVVFISHTWAGESESEAAAPEYSTTTATAVKTPSPYRDNPDNAAGDKFRLVVQGVGLLHQKLAGGGGDCFVWFDFSCLDQSQANPALEFREHAREIFGCCDCVLSPLVDRASAALSEGELEAQTGPLLTAYRGLGWNGRSKNSFLNRAWCRLEMW